MGATEQTIGQKMKARREAKGYSVEEVNLRLRIHPEAIRKIEEDDFSNWPGGQIYIKGFVKQYADFLDMNTDEVMNDFESLGIRNQPVEFVIGAQKEESVEHKLRSFAVPLKRYRKQILQVTAFVVGAAVAVALVSSAYVGIKNWWSSRPVKVKVEKKTPKPNPPVPVRTAPVREQVAEPAQVSQPAPATPEAPTVIEIDDGFLNSPARNNFPSIKKSQSIVMDITATTDVWMRLFADGEVVFESILKRGEKERWVADQDFDLKMGRPEGVQMTVNGYNIGKPGKGKVKQVTVTREGIKQV